MHRPNQATMTDELFEQFIKEDKWIHEIRNACKCCYSDGSFRYYRTVTYPTEYIVSEHQERRIGIPCYGLQLFSTI